MLSYFPSVGTLYIIDHFRHQTSYLAPRLGGIKQKKCIIHYGASRWFLLFYSPKPHSQVWILILYWNWCVTEHSDIQCISTICNSHPSLHNGHFDLFVPLASGHHFLLYLSQASWRGWAVQCCCCCYFLGEGGGGGWTGLFSHVL